MYLLDAVNRLVLLEKYSDDFIEYINRATSNCLNEIGRRLCQLTEAEGNINAFEQAGWLISLIESLSKGNMPNGELTEKALYSLFPIEIPKLLENRKSYVPSSIRTIEELVMSIEKRLRAYITDPKTYIPDNSRRQQVPRIIPGINTLLNCLRSSPDPIVAFTKFKKWLDRCPDAYMTKLVDSADPNELIYEFIKNNYTEGETILELIPEHPLLNKIKIDATIKNLFINWLWSLSPTKKIDIIKAKDITPYIAEFGSSLSLPAKDLGIILPNFDDLLALLDDQTKDRFLAWIDSLSIPNRRAILAQGICKLVTAFYTATKIPFSLEALAVIRHPSAISSLDSLVDDPDSIKEIERQKRHMILMIRECIYSTNGFLDSLENEIPKTFTALDNKVQEAVLVPIQKLVQETADKTISEYIRTHDIVTQFSEKGSFFDLKLGTNLFKVPSTYVREAFEAIFNNPGIDQLKSNGKLILDAGVWQDYVIQLMNLQEKEIDNEVVKTSGYRKPENSRVIFSLTKKAFIEKLIGKMAVDRNPDISNTVISMAMSIDDKKFDYFQLLRFYNDVIRIQGLARQIGDSTELRALIINLSTSLTKLSGIPQATQLRELNKARIPIVLGLDNLAIQERSANIPNFEKRLKSIYKSGRSVLKAKLSVAIPLKIKSYLRTMESLGQMISPDLSVLPPS